MKQFITTLIITLVLSTSTCIAQRKCGSAPGSQKHFMQVRIEKVDNNNSDGVSRISCALVGIPHTSSRVDSVIAVVKGVKYKSTDIDGVDYGRYFQWEEDGVIPVDVDVKSIKRFTNRDSLKFYTVYGVFTAPFKSRNKK